MSPLGGCLFGALALAASAIDALIWRWRNRGRDETSEREAA